MGHPRLCRGANRSSRRTFFKAAAAATAAVAAGHQVPGAEPGREQRDGELQTGKVVRITEHLFVFAGAIHVGILRDGGNALLIDAGDGSVAGVLPGLGVSAVQRILFTHYHRDQACGAYAMAAAGARIGVPAAEREYFADPAAYWNDDQRLWHAYQFRPHRLMLVAPLRVDETFTGNDRLTFGPAKIRVLSTPGHTDGSVSYLVEVDGRRVVFSGDCIYDEGQLWDVYSLQKGFRRGGRQIRGYHGFLGDHWRLIESLKRIKNTRPDLLVPAHGKLMAKPEVAIDALVERLGTCYENYVAISALRHYFPELFTEFSRRPGQMPIRPGFAPPDCLRHFGTTWMLRSKSGAAWVMDVGSPAIVRRLEKMLARREIQRIEGLWVTHYHDDHTQGIPQFQQRFDCPCVTDRRVADVLTNPTAWRLPCVFPTPVRVHRPLEDGQSWTWREFRMTAYYYPGQTLYHAGLLVEHDGLRMLFAGDSHTMAGIDDYCAFNRNWLGDKVGFSHCLALIEKIKPTHIFNCHVNDAFTFTADEIQFMRQNLDQREKLFGQLVPWDHANYGLDPSWIRCYPYTQQVKPGSETRLDVVVTNHSAAPRAIATRPAPSAALATGAGTWIHSRVAPKSEARLRVTLPIATDARPGRHVVPVDIRFGSRDLPEFAEAIIEV